MRHSHHKWLREAAKSEGRPLVGAVVDGASSYGRSILRGVLRYANLQRRWILHEDLWPGEETINSWPACDGAIVAGAGSPILSAIRSRSRHVISCSGSTDPATGPVVSLDDHAAGALAAEHLMDCRLERFGFYGIAGAQTVATKRLAGFKRALEQKNFSCVESPVSWPYVREWRTHSHRPQLIEWLRELQKPAGILAADDAAAHDLAGACLEAGIGVPDHVAIIGVNNDDLLCEGAWPPLSSVEPDYSRMGYVAAKMLDRLLSGEDVSAEDRCVRLPPIGVVQRVSTSVLAVGDVNLADAVRFIREHACDPCSVDDVLREVPVGRRWLERQFVSQLGRTPHDEIIRVRMDAARRLLLQPDLNLPLVAERCGFSLVQFTRTFRHVFGSTPAAYRRAAFRGVPDARR